MKKLTTRVAALVLAALLFAFAVAADPIEKISDLKVGAPATIKVRIGERVPSKETAKTHVFTMRDDFGAGAYGYTKRDVSDMRFGATYLLKGTLRRDPKTKQEYFDVTSWELAYPFPLWPIVGAIGVIVVVCGAGFFFFARRLKSVKPREPWDYAEIISGPDQGALIPLRFDEIPVGRRQDPELGLSIASDIYVSRNQGTIIRKGGDTYYRDNDSRCGSFVNEQWVEPGQDVLVPPGALLRLGPHTTIRVGSASSSGLTSDTQYFEDDPPTHAEGWQDTNQV